MTSEIRANKQTNRVGLGTVEYTNTGIIVSGIVTCTELSGLTALSISGVGTANALDINGDIDVDGHTNLDNLSVAGVTTFSNKIQVGTGVTIEPNGQATFTGIVTASSLVLDAVPGTNTNAQLPVLFQTTSGTIDGGSQLTYDPGGDVLRVNNLRLAQNEVRASGNGPLHLTTANANGVVDIDIKHTHVEINGNLLPATDSTDSLGSNTVRWANLYADTLYGDGSNLTGITGTTINNNADNRVITGSGTANTLEGESLLTFDGNVLLVASNSYNILEMRADENNDGGNDDNILKFTHDGTFRAEMRYDQSSSTLELSTSDNRGDIVIDSSGRILLGTATVGRSGADELTIGNGSGDIGLSIRSGTSNEGNIYFSDSTSSGNGENRGIIRFDHSDDSMQFFTASGNNFSTEKLRIKSTGEVHISDRNSSNTGDHFFQAGAFGIRMEDTGGYNRWNIERNYGGYQSTPLVHLSAQGRVGINQATPTANLHVGGAYNETGAIINGGALGYNDVLQCHTANGHRRFTVAGDGTIYGPSGGRKNWFDNGSFDCIGGRRANTSMDYGNHHAYGWVTDRFQSRNSVQWTRSTNVPAGKGFSYSTQTNGAGGRLVQAVELPDYGDMGVFAPNSYWCVSIWSTASINQGGQAFSYDLGSTKTGISIVHPSSGGSYQTTGETASGTSTGTFTRYYMVFQMPSSIISTATSAYWTWAFNAAGYATGWQLERVPTATSKPTPYEHVHPSVTIARCRRYAYQCVNSRMMNGYKRHDGQISWTERFPVPPTHMPSGSNQSVPPYGITLHDGGMLTNFQSILQNPGVNSVQLSEFDYRSGRFLIVGSTSWSSTHTTAPSWESQEYEIGHGHF